MPTSFDGVNPRGTQTLIPCKDAVARNGVKANTKLISESIWGESGKNLLDYPFFTETPSTLRDVVATQPQKGVINLNGTATGGVVVFYLNYNKKLENGDYRLFLGADSSDVTILAEAYNGSVWVKTLGGDSFADNERRFTVDNVGYDNVRINIRVKSGATVSNVLTHPMLIKAEIPDTSFEAPYESVKDTLREAEVIKGKNIFDTRNAVANRNDLTHVKNKDLSLSISAGTATNEWFYPANQDLLTPLNVKAGQKYKLSYGKTLITNLRVQVFYKETSASSYVQLANESTKPYVEFTAPNTFYNIWARFSVAAGNSIAACTIYPMLTLADENLDYETFYGSPLKDSMFPRSEQAILGAKNLMPFPYYNANGSENGVTWATNDDGTVTVSTPNGPSTAQVNIHLIRPQNFPSWLYNVPLKLSGCPSGGSATTYQMGAYLYDGTNSTNDYGNGTDSFAFTSAGEEQLSINIRPNVTLSTPLTFKPLLTLASDTECDYEHFVSPAMTNKELTEKVFEKGILTNANDLNDIKTTGIYGVTTAPANSPENKEYATLIVKKVTPTLVHQMFIRPDCIYTRRYDLNQSTPWGNWFKFTGTMLS